MFVILQISSNASRSSPVFNLGLSACIRLWLEFRIAYSFLVVFNDFVNLYTQIDNYVMAADMLHQGVLLLYCSCAVLWSISCIWKEIMDVKAGILKSFYVQLT